MLKEYKTLFPFIKKYKYNYIFGFLFLVLTDGGQLIIPQLIRKAIDTITQENFVQNDILFLMIKLVSIALAVVIGRVGWRLFIQGASRKIENELRSAIFSKLLVLSSTFYDKNKTGDLMARATNDMKAIRRASGMALVAFTDGIFMSLAILIILFTQYSKIALLTIIPLPLLSVIVVFFGRTIGDKFKKVQEGFSKLSDEIQESISGIRVIKSFVREPYTLKSFSKSNLKYKSANMELVKIWGFFFPLITFLSGLTILILLKVGGAAVINNTISPGSFVAFLNYLAMLIWPMLGTGFTINIIQRGSASLSRINSILNENPDITSPDKAVQCPIKGNIKIKNLNFKYPYSEETILKNINIEITKGETLGILGRTGSGKTSLVKMLQRIIDPPDKTIFIDNIDIKKYDLNCLRTSIGLVPQNTFLFSASIKENIAFGNPEIDESILKRAAEISTISKDIKNFPDKWETQVGEKGLSLSGGQKQRVAISRAITIEPEILIFDDALSAVDTETEKNILKEFINIRKGKTNIIISHRVSTLSNSDKIIVIDNGEIIQKGTHKELIKKEGFYQEIYNLQKLEEGKE